MRSLLYGNSLQKLIKNYHSQNFNKEWIAPNIERPDMGIAVNRESNAVLTHMNCLHTACFKFVNCKKVLEIV